MSGHTDGDKTKESNQRQTLEQSSHDVLRFSL
jgi:hypothetical protein